jgi:hypothetical protein
LVGIGIFKPTMEVLEPAAMVADESLDGRLVLSGAGVVVGKAGFRDLVDP